MPTVSNKPVFNEDVKTGERTKPQTASALGELLGFGFAPQANYNTYRLMRADPTVALGLKFATAPIRLANWAYESDKAPAGAVEFIQSQLAPIKDHILRNALLAIQYGWAPFEKVFENKDGAIVLHKIKPLRVDTTKILVDKAHGAFRGLEADEGKTNLPADNAFVFTNESEAGDFYGYSRFENIRKDLFAMWNLRDKQGQFIQKVASVIPIIHYPMGEEADDEGANKANFELARDILTKMSQAYGVAIPNVLSPNAEQLMRFKSPAALHAWQIEFIEANTNHGDSFVNQRRHMESLVLRGLCVPERAAIEGNFGTKAESKEHANIGIQIAELTLRELVQSINWYIVDHLLELNYGTNAKGTVWIQPEPVLDEKKSMLRQMITQAFGAPVNVDVLAQKIDLDSAFETLGIPKGEGFDDDIVMPEAETVDEPEQPVDDEG